MTHPWFGATGTPRVLAHRGLVTPRAAADGAAENSFAAFAEAHAAGALYVESDCQLTRDGTVVLFHDDDLLRVTGDPRAVADIDERELSNLMAPRGGLATLRDTIEAFPSLHFNLDVKAAAAAVPVGRQVAAHGARVLLTSFSDERRRAALAAARAAGADIAPATSAGTATIARLLVAIAARSPALVRRTLAGIDAVQIPERRRRPRVFTPRLVDAVHRAGAEVHVWTINDESEMLRAVERGADGVVTDRADVALGVLGGR